MKFVSRCSVNESPRWANTGHWSVGTKASCPASGRVGMACRGFYGTTYSMATEHRNLPVSQSLPIIARTGCSIQRHNMARGQGDYNKLSMKDAIPSTSSRTIICSKFCTTRTAGDQKNVRLIRNFVLDDVFWMEERRESLGELYALCDNSSYNCSSYAESTVCTD